jgi:alkylation response protein AidB-like acyl-CoA dehydrogenase
MDLDLSEEQEFFRDATRKFLEAEVPIETVRKLADVPAGFDRSWWQRGAELGFTSMLVPEEHGGASLGGEGLLDLVIVAEEMGRRVSPGPFAPTNVVAAAISRAGTREQQAEWLPTIVAGESLATWALSEPGGRRQPDDLAVTARRADGGFVLSGTKEPVEAGADVDWILVTARGDDGPVQLLVPASCDGLTTTRLESLDLVRRHAALHFDEVFVPDRAVLGTAASTAEDVEHQLQIALVLQAAETVGATDRVFEVTLEWMFDRFSFGRPLASYQALKHRCAHMKLTHEPSAAAATAAARAVQQGDEEAALKASAAKAWVGENEPFVIQECVQMHGGLGLTWEYDLHLYLRRVTTNQVTYGTPSQHRERIARLLGVDDEVTT